MLSLCHRKAVRLGVTKNQKNAFGHQILFRFKHFPSFDRDVFSIEIDCLIK